MIYLIINKVNGKRYIGKTTKTLEERWYRHIKDAEYGSDTFFHRAIRKHGAHNFSIEFLAEGLEEEEVKMIKAFNPEYNMTQGGDGGDTSLSPNYRIAMSRRNYTGSNNPNYGKRGAESPNYGSRRTLEQKANISNSDYLKKKKRVVKINDVIYESVQAAARAHNRSERWVRLHDEYTTRFPLVRKV